MCQLHVKSPCGKELSYKVEGLVAVANLELAESLQHWRRFRATCREVEIRLVISRKANQLRLELLELPLGGQTMAFRIFGKLFDEFAGGAEPDTVELAMMVKRRPTALVGDPA